MADPNSSGDSDTDTDIPGSENPDVSHHDGGFRKFFSSVKKLSKRVASLSESPASSPTIPEENAKSPTDSTSNPQGSSGDCNYRSRGVAVLIVNVTFSDKKMSPDRIYAKRDIEVFEKILNSLNFTIIKLIDHCTADLRRRLKEIRSSLTSDCDCFLCLISSHGLETRISDDKRKRQHTTFTYDRWIPTDSIIRPFTENECRCLRGKPKLFFIQACRTVHRSADADSVDRGVVTKEAVYQPPGRHGDIRDNPVRLEGTGNTLIDNLRADHDDPNSSSQDPSQSIREKVNLDEIPFADDTDDSDDYDMSTADNSRVGYYPPRPRKSDDVDFCTIPCYPHCLVMFSSAPERFAWSNDYKGGWLPYCMYEVLSKMAQRHFRIDLLQALTEVNETMANSLETNSPEDKVLHQVKSAACIYHMLTKDVYFTPKYAPVPVVDRVQESAV